MSKKSKNNLGDLISNVKKFENTLESMNGKTFDITSTDMFVPGPALHQKSATQTEEESAKFELKHPKVFTYFRSLFIKMHRMLKP